MSRYEDYQNLNDMKILQGLGAVNVIQAIIDPDTGIISLGVSWNYLKMLNDNNVVPNIKIHYDSENPDGSGDVMMPLASIYISQPGDPDPDVYGAYFCGGTGDITFEATDPDELMTQGGLI